MERGCRTSGALHCRSGRFSSAFRRSCQHPTPTTRLTTRPRNTGNQVRKARWTWQSNGIVNTRCRREVASRVRGSGDVLHERRHTCSIRALAAAHRTSGARGRAMHFHLHTKARTRAYYGTLATLEQVCPGWRSMRIEARCACIRGSAACCPCCTPAARPASSFWFLANLSRTPLNK
jgi:hypothetical protein